MVCGVSELGFIGLKDDRIGIFPGGSNANGAKDCAKGAK
jgi:hypothetical protein